jgi:TonB family protein
MLVCFAFAAVAFADVPTGYDFNVRVVPTERRSGYNVHVNIDAPDGSFAGISETAALPAEQKMTFERNGRTYTVVLRMTSDIQGTADFEVMEKGAVIAHTEKSFGRPLIEKPMPKSFEPPKVLERVEPTYPEEARAARVGGPVVLETRINADGTIGDIRVLRPLGYGIDEAAVAAVRQWKFRPAMQDGKPVSVAYSVTLFFKP